MTIPPYPLTWPSGWRRTNATSRVRAKFNRKERRGSNSWTTAAPLTIADAVRRVLDELEQMGAIKDDDIVISTNVRVRLDGLPRSGEPEPTDPGVAVYWTVPYEPTRCMAIDIYDRVADNLAAVAATLNAMRAIERHGGAAILDRAFTGFTALPAPGAPKTWREVLGVGPSATLNEARAAYRRLASENHPDKGGTAEAMAEVNRAWQEAQEALT